MKDFNISHNKNCPCSQKECPIRGNCVLCIQNHIVHKRHIPECIQNLLRKDIESLSRMVELKTEEQRPDKEFWKSFDKEALVESSLKKHKD